jgi:hypothetical protein
MVDYSLLCIAPHLFVVMLILIKNPFEVGHTLSKLYFLPYFTLIHDASYKIFVVIAVDYSKSKLFAFVYFYFQLLIDLLIGSKVF